MSIEKAPKWVQEQVKTGLEVSKEVDIKKYIDDLSKETLISFFTKNSDTKFSNEGPTNGAAHIIAYQKALNLLDPNARLDTDGVFGGKTKQALQKFQINNSLKGANGYPGPITARALIIALGNIPIKETTITLTVAPERIKTPTEYLISEGYKTIGEGKWQRDDLTIIIGKDSKVDYERDKKRLFGSWKLSDKEEIQIKELAKLIGIANKAA